MNQTIYDGYLAHYGVKGMKWGQRKDRKKDRIRLNRSERKQVRKIKRERKKASKRRMLLSDEELNSRIKRMETEKKLKELTSESVYPGKTAAKKIINSRGGKAIAGVAISAASGTTAYALKVATENKFKFKDIDDIKSKIDYEEAAKYVAPNPNAKKKKK